MSAPPARPGFTLVELLVVLGIVALLIAILLPALSHVRDEAVRAQCANGLHQLVAASVLHLNEHKDYPPAPQMPALNGVLPSAITPDLLNALGRQMRWLAIDAATPLPRLPPQAACPFRRRIELFESADTVSYGVPVFITGYSYTARLTEGGPNAFGIPLMPKRGADRHGSHRGVLWCDSVTFLQTGGTDAGYSFFHARGPVPLNPATGTSLSARPLLGQNRGYDDGSVEYVAAGAIDTARADLATACAYDFDLPGHALTLWYWF